jgi:hypothetical protein
VAQPRLRAGRQPPGHLSQLERRRRVCEMAQRERRQNMSPSHRSRVGVRLPGRHHHALSYRRNHQHRPGQLQRQLHLRLRRQGRLPSENNARRQFQAQPMGALRHARQRVGVVRRCLRRVPRRPRRGSDRPNRAAARRLACPARGLVILHTVVLSFRAALQARARRSGPQLRVPCRAGFSLALFSLSLLPFSRGPRGGTPSRAAAKN